MNALSIVNRFIKYAKIHTTSDPDSTSHPSTKRQFDLAELLKSECESMGLKDISLDKHCNLMATLPANTDKDLPILGLVAHMDTSPAMSGKEVKPQIIENYNGKTITLNKEKNIFLSPEVFPDLKEVVGLDLIVTDGTTLLGADDKAGVASIMEAMDYFTTHPKVKHGEIHIAFTPDEEIGQGTDTFDLEKFNCDFALTIDGGKLGEVQYECFNAASALVTIHGQNVHPGSAKGKMVNAITIANELDRRLPEKERPEYTEGYEGFFHLDQIKGNVEEVKMDYIIRDHDHDRFIERKELMKKVVEELNKKYDGAIELNLEDSYYNMAEKIKPHMSIVHRAIDVLKDMEIEPIVEPIRGGTDGSVLSWKGLPTPNIFTGGMNFHGKYEYIPIQHLEKTRDFIINYIVHMEENKN